MTRPGSSSCSRSGPAARLLLVAVERIDGRVDPARPVRALDLLALAAVAAAVARRRARVVDRASLAAGSDPLLALLPGLAALAAGARGRPPRRAAAAPGGTRRRGAARPAVRLALVSLGRQGGRPALVIAFLTAALGLAVFALSYRDTLDARARTTRPPSTCRSTST